MAGTQLHGEPIKAVAAAVVNFEQLARLDASKVQSNSQQVPHVIHSPITPPEVETPSGTPVSLPPLAPKSDSIAPSEPSPSPAANFAGLDDIPKVGTGSIVIPPDTDGAVGLDRLMVGLNNNYRIQNKTTGATISTVSVDTFWSASGGTGFFDPRTLYDPINNRWIVCILSDVGGANASIEIGVSQTGDPSGSYYIFRFDVDSTNANWADFPCVGFNKKWIAINVNMFSNSGNAYVNSKMLVVDYAQLRAGTGTGIFLTGTGFCSSPAATYTAAEETLYVPTHLSSAGGTYRMDTITGIAASPVYTVGATKSRGITWAQPGGDILPQAAPLSGSSVCGATPCKMETQDAQIRSTPVVRGGYLYYAQTVGLPAGGLTHTAAQWTKLDASGGANTGNVVDGGRVEDPTATSTNGGKWYAYPHIAVNQYGDIILGFSQYSSSQYPAAGYTVHKRTDGAGTMDDPLIYKAGEDYYHKDFGTARNRWGDYSKAQVDPSNDTDLWVLNEYAKARVGTDDGTSGSNSSKWGTWWAKVSFTPTEVTISTMSAGIYGDGVELKWRTGMEVANLGFNVYRDEGTNLTRLNRSILAGSALLAGTETALLAGNTYSWRDAEGRAESRYWVEDINLEGVGTWHGPVSPEPVPGVMQGPLPVAAPGLLERLGGSARGSGSPVSTGATLPVDTAARVARQAVLAAGEGVKILVREEGFYRVTQPELVAAGLDPRTDPQRLHLYVDGREVPMVVRGEEDRRFDSSDSIEFYGVGLDIPSTDKRAYWLTSSGEAGLRMRLVSGVGRGADIRSFPYTIESRERRVYFSALRNGEGENFFGAVVGNTAVEQPLVLPNLYTAGAEGITLQVTLQGVTQVPHRVRVMVNDVDLGEMAYAGQEKGVGSYTIPAARLMKYMNRVRLVSQGGSTDTSVVESIRVTYPHGMTADNEVLRFPVWGGQAVWVDGFSSPSIRVLDITEGDNAAECRVDVRQRGAGYAVQAVPAGRGQRVLLAMSENQVKQAERVVGNRGSSWRQGGKEADLVIITHGDFKASLEPLRALRTSQGLKTVVVDIEDIYDEFSYGHKTAQAIRDFLRFAKQRWLKAPRYVLLVGDASFDPRNYLGKGEGDYVPTKLIDTGNMETASDEWFVDLEGTGQSQMAIGRLPVRSAEEAERLVAKIMRYEQAGSRGGALLISDISDTYDFKGSNEALKEAATKVMGVEEIVRGSNETVVLQKQLMEGLNAGKRIVNYMGHGSVDIWRGNFFTSADARGLTNAQNLGIFVAATCLNGYFINPDVESLGEAMLRSERGGAVAAWTSTGVTDPVPQAEVSRHLFDLLLNAVKGGGERLTIGEAVTIAKSWVKDPDVRRTYLLLGDPAMKMK